MPVLLRYDAIRLLEASTECLHLAVLGLGASKRNEFRQPSATYAAEIGLIGSAAELAMSACIVQAFGAEAIAWPSGQYKTAGAIINEFRQLVRNATANSQFLVQGVNNPEEHRNNLLRFVTLFRRLIPARAGGLHAGRGLKHEATVLQANNVSDFLELLSQSNKIQPYLNNIPRCLWYSQDREIIIEDLARHLRQSRGAERTSLLTSVYLTLPDIPDEIPDWLETFDRVTISPRERDIVYLLDVLEQAVPATLRHVGREGANINATVRHDDPDALPIAPHFLRRQFNQIPDQYFADVANANGRFETDGYIDVPPPEAIKDLFAIGLERSGIINEQNHYLTAHQSWPGIVSSLSTHGTCGPYWFLVRKTSDFGQLISFLQQVTQIASRQVHTRIAECIHGIEAIRHNQSIEREDEIFAQLLSDINKAEERKELLPEKERRNRNHARALPENMRDELEEISHGGQPIGPLLIRLIEKDQSQECLTYWTRVLSECALEADDIPALVAVIATNEARAGHSEARKALRRIDFRIYGPAVY